MAKKIRKAYALDIEFIIQFYFPEAKVKTYGSSSTGPDTTFNVGFAMQLNTHGRKHLSYRKKRRIKPHTRYISASTWSFNLPEYGKLSYIEHRIINLLNVFKGKATMDFI